MNTKIIPLLLLVSVLFTTSSCCVFHCSKQSKTMNSQLPSPQVIIYTTKADYAKLVPINLSPDRKSVISYPDIKDVLIGGVPAYPTVLHKGYLLDNRGISANVAFIKLTYEEYAALPKTPTADELLKMVVDKLPVTRMYACGLKSKYSNLAEELNAAIDAGNFSSFNRLK
jgi:hypothetical protein